MTDSPCSLLHYWSQYHDQRSFLLSWSCILNKWHLRAIEQENSRVNSWPKEREVFFQISTNHEFVKIKRQNTTLKEEGATLETSWEWCRNDEMVRLDRTWGTVQCARLSTPNTQIGSILGEISSPENPNPKLPCVVCMNYTAGTLYAKKTTWDKKKCSSPLKLSLSRHLLCLRLLLLPSWSRWCARRLNILPPCMRARYALVECTTSMHNSTIADTHSTRVVTQCSTCCVNARPTISRDSATPEYKSACVWNYDDRLP